MLLVFITNLAFTQKLAIDKWKYIEVDNNWQKWGDWAAPDWLRYFGLDMKDINHDGDFDEEGEGKIYGKTAIPCGRYKVIVNLSRKLKRRLPLLLDVPGFEGIRIHGGKNETHTEGCILVGENLIKGQLVNYGYWENKIVQMLDESLDKIYITIKE